MHIDEGSFFREDGALHDGVLLWELLSVLSGKPLHPPLQRSPKMRIQMVSNLSISINFLKQRVKLVGIGAEGNVFLAFFYITVRVVRSEVVFELLETFHGGPDVKRQLTVAVF